jgi:hypothetical protein
MKLPVFVYEDIPFMKVVPVKRLFNSTMVHEVVTRGDFFAVNLINNTLTVLPQGADVVTIKETQSTPTQEIIKH